MLLVSCSNHTIDFDYVQIIPDAEEKAYRFSDYDQHFELTRKDLKDAEQILYEAVNKHQNEYTLTLTPETLRGFKRQYVAYINQEGKKMIWINGFCEVLDIPTEMASGEFEMKPFTWKEKILDVDDGGDCYWHIMINMDSKKYELSVNGI